MLRHLTAIVLLLIFLAVGLWWIQAQPSPVTDKAPPSERATAQTLTPVGAEPASTTHVVRPNKDETKVKLKILDEILNSRNDNDRRLDTEFSRLSPETKLAMREKYSSLAPEKRNERGTLVFILGRNLTGPEDVKFLQEVLQEKPCLSLADCSVAAKPETSVSPKDQDAAMGNDVTLVYPQIVALKSVEKFFQSGAPVPALAPALRKVIQTGQASASPTVARVARRIRDHQAGS